MPAVDYSDARPNPEALRALGYTLVLRYIAGGTSDKHLTLDEARRLHAAGVQILVIFESTATRAAAGFAAGVYDASSALRAANALGYPVSDPIFFAVDFDAIPAQVRPYFEGVVRVLRTRAGVYGGYDITTGLADLIKWRWQTKAWSAGRVDPQAHLVQQLTMRHPIPGCDENVIQHAIPTWGPATPPPAPVASSSKVNPAAAQVHVDAALAHLKVAVGEAPAGAYHDGVAAALKELNQLPKAPVAPASAGGSR